MFRERKPSWSMEERKYTEMRLNVKRVMEIMQKKGLTEEMICTRTGLYPRSLQWILDKGCISEEAIERIADAMGIEVKALENAILHPLKNVRVC